MCDKVFCLCVYCSCELSCALNILDMHMSGTFFRLLLLYRLLRPGKTLRSSLFIHLSHKIHIRTKIMPTAWREFLFIILFFLLLQASQCKTFTIPNQEQLSTFTSISSPNEFCYGKICCWMYWNTKKMTKPIKNEDICSKAMRIKMLKIVA